MQLPFTLKREKIIVYFLSFFICIWCSIDFIVISNVKDNVPIRKTVYKSMMVDKININTAPIHLLETLPYIGIKTANDIIKYRNENGKFSSKEQVLKIKGIGKTKFKKIKERIIL